MCLKGARTRLGLLIRDDGKVISLAVTEHGSWVLGFLWCRQVGNVLMGYILP